ncbi:hypothetical protein DFH06DRAFT_85388 [Mycena polygramma]|nr:hypothetical protein DFH06DRAFT_85388 [Mycena polygramma]
MADTPHPDARSSSTSIIGNPGVISSGLFSGAQNFTATGHTFQNITYAALTEPSNYRTFPPGDIDLQREICLDNDTGVVWRLGGSNRRLYSARIGERSVTVAMYQGDGADEEWREYNAKHSPLRHPNIIQIYGTASSGGLHATVFHGDLIPFERWLDPYKCFPCVIVFLHAYYAQDFYAANYFSQIGISTVSDECTMWIRRSTGRLCVDLMGPQKPIDLDYDPELTISGSEATALFSRNTRIIEALAIDALTLENYHEVCARTLNHTCIIDVPAGVTVYLGMVIPRPSNNDFVEIALLPETDIDFFGWYDSGGVEREIMESGWIRLNARGGTLVLHCWADDAGSWFSQSNHIFKRCQIASNFEDYVFVHYIRFEVGISAATKEIPTGFLFLCPTRDFRTRPSSMGWPDCPAYWSLESSGAHPLSREEAIELGFPTLQFIAKCGGSSWDSSVYAGIRQFHQAKGFDPYSQEVARHLGYTLYQPSANFDPVFAHVIEEEDGSEVEDGSDSQMDVDRDDAENHRDDSEDLSDMELD